MDFGFTKGELNGYSTNIFLRNPIVETEDELAVVGGRGTFKMAKGQLQQTSTNTKSSNMNLSTPQRELQKVL
ncbi:hypothetical protein J1N35_042162 [Gossypium stocksii]|uniref:Dirigent protein n=1 Tax=Gossypium stocksii TaxID=47602 RepID=A0A9D3UH67_9ROSI|nr:hypothetical protein J1N35_042162 [Gossypium stocksii]